MKSMTRPQFLLDWAKNMFSKAYSFLQEPIEQPENPKGHKCPKEFDPNVSLLFC